MFMQFLASNLQRERRRSLISVRILHESNSFVEVDRSTNLTLRRSKFIFRRLKEKKRTHTHTNKNVGVDPATLPLVWKCVKR